MSQIVFHSEDARRYRLLAESEKFRTIELPHGPLLKQDLLDKVEAKLTDTYDKKKRVGSENWIYMLSHILYYEDGTKFTGEAEKGTNIATIIMEFPKKCG